MDIKYKKALDQIGIKILRELQMNARTAFSEIGRRVGLSSPAVAERVQKRKEAGIICGYHANIDPEKIGYPISAFIHLTTKTENTPKVYEFARNASEVIECHIISGKECFILRVIASSVSNLGDLVEELSAYGETKTSIVLSSPVKKSYIEI
jgi:Lrp/AsnC family transcriptional regulator, leucine-responsive regulatory protein